MQQHLGRLDGVAKAEVSLKDGTAVVYPKQDGTLDPALILKATYDSGVTVAEMTMTAAGHVLKDAQGLLIFQVAANRSFPIVPNDLSRNLEGLAGTSTNRRPENCDSRLDDAGDGGC